MTKAHYDALRPTVLWESNYPEGALLHACAIDEAGAVHVCDLWESEE
jgi:hypothetical protein